MPVKKSLLGVNTPSNLFETVCRRKRRECGQIVNGKFAFAPFYPSLQGRLPFAEKRLVARPQEKGSKRLVKFRQRVVCVLPCGDKGKPQNVFGLPLNGEQRFDAGRVAVL